MRAIDPVVVTAVGSICMLGSAMAADLTGVEIDQLIAVKTVYLELTAASSVATPGKGVLFFGSDGNVLYKLRRERCGTGHGPSRKTPCGVFKEFPNNPCTKYDKQSDEITLLDAAPGQLRARLLKTEPGNAENLAP